MGYPGTSSNVLSAHVVDKALLLAEDSQPETAREGPDRTRTGVGAAWCSLAPALVLAPVLAPASCSSCSCWGAATAAAAAASGTWNLQSLPFPFPRAPTLHPHTTPQSGVPTPSILILSPAYSYSLPTSRASELPRQPSTLDSPSPSFRFGQQTPSDFWRSISRLPTTSPPIDQPVPGLSTTPPPGRTWAF